jgi:hypothetical protein
MDWSHVAEDTAQCRGSLHNINFRLPSSATSAVKTHGGPHTPAVSIPYNPAIPNSGSLVLLRGVRTVQFGHSVHICCR